MLALTILLLSNYIIVTNQETLPERKEECIIDQVDGYLKYKCNNGYLKCHNSNEMYRYTVNPWFESDMEGQVCSNDPYGYQACNDRYPRPQSGELLCGMNMCTAPVRGRIFTSNDIPVKLLCEDKHMVCQNTEDKDTRCSDASWVLRSGQQIAPELICNGECDEWSCEDEADCDGLPLKGMYCEGHELQSTYTAYVIPGNICDGTNHCPNGEDEREDLCNVKDWEKPWCNHWWTNKAVPLYPFTRCAKYLPHSSKYCTDFKIDKSNCSYPGLVGGQCRVDGYWSDIFKDVICEKRWPLCDDGIDDQCLDVSVYCTNLHKHYMCDGKNDCEDRTDENHFTCSPPLQDKVSYCQRKIGQRRKLPILSSWYLDGVEDCVDGEDELSKECGKGITERTVPLHAPCQNVFLCPFGGFIELTKLCDGLHTCGNERQICELSRNTKRFSSAVLTTDSLTRHLSYCIKGITSIATLRADECIKEEFMFSGNDLFGLSPITLNLPRMNQDCDYLYGESYVLTSCAQKCKKSECMLKYVPSNLACPNQLKNRVLTIAYNQFLTFAIPNRDKSYMNNYFVCDGQSLCIDYGKVCDLVKDCQDGSDEEGCTNNYKCSSSDEFIPKTELCDGKFDCMDLTDECNKYCSKNLLESTYLKVLAIAIGVIAFLANLLIMIKNVFTIRKCRTIVAVVNKSMVILIALGDFMMGLYLLFIVYKDMVVYSNGYCLKQLEWLLSGECATLGVLSTIGSQVSLFAMTVLSLVRLHGIQGKLRVPGQINIIKILQVVLAVLGIILASTLIAIFPLLLRFEDYFVNGIIYPNKLKLFIGFTKKQTIQPVLGAYYGRMKKTTLTWKMNIEMISEMFSHDQGYEDFTEPVGKIHFYGSDGVCLFKYFVGKEDPQKMFVWGILITNFTCFLFISLSYILIGMISRTSSSSVRGTQNNELTKRNRRMNQRIAIIILTDFCCWIPFIVICGLNSMEVLDATPWYSLFSMVILPINSVINPFLYDNFLTTVFLPLLRLPFVSHLRTLPVTVYHSMATTFENTTLHHLPEQVLTTATSLHIPERAHRLYSVVTMSPRHEVERPDEEKAHSGAGVTIKITESFV